MAEKSKATDDSTIDLPYNHQETMLQLLLRLNIDPKDIGEVIVNFIPSTLDTVIPYDNSRISIFPIGMSLLCGAAHMRGHHYTHRDKEVTVEYYGAPTMPSIEQWAKTRSQIKHNK
ncbi:MAG: hypothetical protein ACW99A_10055 [Candidatus Kariarchaeaceae archaeon]